MKTLPQRLTALPFIFLLVFCSNPKSEEPALRFIRASQTVSMDSKTSFADSILHNSVPVIQDSQEQYVYVVNPECSFCIASAISCCNAWNDTGIEAPFYFLIKSDYTELFEFYLERDCKKKVPFFTSDDCTCLSDGLFTLRKGHVSSYSSWSP